MLNPSNEIGKTENQKHECYSNKLLEIKNVKLLNLLLFRVIGQE